MHIKLSRETKNFLIFVLGSFWAGLFIDYGEMTSSWPIEILMNIGITILCYLPVILIHNLKEPK